MNGRVKSTTIAWEGPEERPKLKRQEPMDPKWVVSPPISVVRKYRAKVGLNQTGYYPGFGELKVGKRTHQEGE